MNKDATALKNTPTEIDSVVVRFAGDSGDGMQLVGQQFTDTSALAGNDISTLPDFPAEIRAPQGTLPGVSGFQIHFGGTNVLTPGDAPDALVAMNPAALKVNLNDLVAGGLLILNTDAFTPENLKKAGYTLNPLDDPEIESRYRVVKIDITSLTTDALEESPLKAADKLKCKNFFAMGFVYWVYERSLDFTKKWIQTKWVKKPDVAAANLKALQSGYYFGETSEISIPQYRISPAQAEPGVYRRVNGNEALVMGFVAASEACLRDILYSGYPITPASPILEGLAGLKKFRVKTIQAEDEIAAIGVAIGASYSGALGITATSGPGICLKSEAMGLAMITEIPLIIVNVQRGGPSTGLPTKVEQSDLLQAMFCRNGESPVPIIAASSPGDCFYTAIDATRIALTYKTPIILLSDNYIANSSEPWKIPDIREIPDLIIDPVRQEENYIPYERDPNTLARRMAIPGRPGFEHRIGGLEKNEQGNVSYDPLNHQKMTELRQEKVNCIAESYPPTEILGEKKGDLLILGWGGTCGAIKAAVNKLTNEGKKVGGVCLRFINPFPLDLEEILKSYDKVLIPEMNMGQLAFLIKAKYLIPVESFCKVQGKPFKVQELLDKADQILSR